jgi:dolichol-phosphate mannosyltransferase
MKLTYNQVLSRKNFTRGPEELREEITVVIPTLNEAEAIGKLIDEIKVCGYKQILVVDGYSKDGTREIAENHLGDAGRIVEQHGRGKSGAILTATEIVDTPFFVVMDGDYTYDPADIDRFIPFMENYDHIIGARPARSPNISMTHKLGNRILTTAFNMLMGSDIPDICSGMYLLRTDKIKQFFFDKPGIVVDQEIAAQSSINGRVTSVPINYRARLGKSKISTWRQGLRSLFTILDLAKSYNPVLLFAGMAIVAIFPAVIILLYTAIQNYVFNNYRWGLALLGAVLLLFSGQGVIIATLSSQMRRLERRLIEKD